MKKIKKLSVVIVALAICMVFTGTVWAVGTDATDEISFVATPSAATLHVSDQPQTVTVTIDASSALSVYGTQGVVVVTGDLEYTIEHFVPLNEADVNYKDGTFAWFDAEVEAQTINKTLLTITVTIPANKTGSFMIGLSDLLYVTGFDEEAGDVAEVSKTNIYTTLTISDHAWGESGYTDNGDGTHTVNYVCGYDANHTKSGDPVEHTYVSGTCECGATEPVANVTVTYKGAALATVYSVNGQTVTVTHTAACKLGYWDATNSKYVALPATHLTGNTYYFTVPAGVTEVLLVVKGDVNGNGSVNILDKNTLGKSVLAKNNANYVPLTEAWQIFAGDVNGNGSVNILDKNTLGKSVLAKNNANYAPLTW